MSRLEVVTLALERAVAGLTWHVRVRRMTTTEHATWLNGLAIASRTAEAYHAREAERQRVERIERAELQEED